MLRRPGDASSLASKGGVYNSRYIYPHIKFRPTENLELIAAYLMAWPDKADGAVIQCGEGDKRGDLQHLRCEGQQPGLGG